MRGWPSTVQGLPSCQVHYTMQNDNITTSGSELEETSDKKGQMDQTPSRNLRPSAFLESTRAPGPSQLSAKLVELDRLTLENTELTVKIKTTKSSSLRKTRRNIVHHSVTLEALDAMVVCTKVENEMLKTGNSSLHEADMEFLNRMEDSESKQLAQIRRCTSSSYQRTCSQLRWRWKN